MLRSVSTVVARTTTKHRAEEPGKCTDHPITPGPGHPGPEVDHPRTAGPISSTTNLAADAGQAICPAPKDAPGIPLVAVLPAALTLTGLTDPPEDKGTPPHIGTAGTV